MQRKGVRLEGPNNWILDPILKKEVTCKKRVSPKLLTSIHAVNTSINKTKLQVALTINGLVICSFDYSHPILVEPNPLPR